MTQKTARPPLIDLPDLIRYPPHFVFPDSDRGSRPRARHTNLSNADPSVPRPPPLPASVNITVHRSNSATGPQMAASRRGTKALELRIDGYLHGNCLR